MKNRKEIYLLLLTLAVLLTGVIFSILNWNTITHLFHEMVSGVAIVEDYIQSLGLVGFFAISLIIIICFFFPVISSVPVQLASAISYGLPIGILHVLFSIFLASQLIFLFTRVTRIFQGPKQRKKQQELEDKINSSNRSILHFLILAYLAPFVPFFLIHTVAANSGMRWRTYSLVTLLGPVPDVVITLWLGEKITSTSSPIVSYVILMLIIACVILSLIYKEKVIDMVFKPRKGGSKSCKPSN